MFEIVKSRSVEGTDLLYPRGGSPIQLRMVFGLPGSRGFLQDLALVAELDLALGQLGQERTTAALADESIDVGNQVDRQDYVRSSA